MYIITELVKNPSEESSFTRFYFNENGYSFPDLKKAHLFDSFKEIEKVLTRRSRKVLESELVNFWSGIEVRKVETEFAGEFRILDGIPTLCKSSKYEECE